MTSRPAAVAYAVDWRARAAEVRWPTASAFIGGRYVEPIHGGESFDTVNPANGKPLRTLVGCSKETVDAAVVSARAAHRDGWRSLSPSARRVTLLAVCAAVESRAEEFALLDSLEMGKPISHALEDVHSSVRFMRYYAEAVDKITGDVAPTDPMRGFLLELREPWGVVGAIVPWNFPLAAACVAVAPALAAGNAVVLKPSEVSPSSALHLAAVASDAGLPAGVLNVVAGLGGTTGAALAAHAGIDKLHFTGSVEAGRSVLEAAGRSNGKPVMLEMGGKSPQIVFEDALGIAGLVESLANAAFFNSGQVCVARSRLLVERSIVREIEARLGRASSRFAPGDPLDAASECGPLASDAQLRKVTGFVREAERSGLRVERCAGSAGWGSGYFTPPAIVSGARPDMCIAREEIFGPVLVVLPFDGIDEALELANDTAFGLAATAWTTNLARVPQLARGLDAGRVEIRASSAPAAPLELFSAEPFRGSGNGVLGGLRGLEPYVRHKAVEIITC
jgi:acyl-CoA reductase-like NAD-dependent aldehyde dehydrogenase